MLVLGLPKGLTVVVAQTEKRITDGSEMLEDMN